MLRVGFLTSGGDCQALNATMRGIAKGLYMNCLTRLRSMDSLRVTRDSLEATISR